MTKEYHAFTNMQETHEQAFIFEVERDESYIRLTELWLITSQGNSEVKTRVNLEEMYEKITHTPGGNLDNEGLQCVVDMFEDVFPNTKKVELQVDICQRELEDMNISDAEKLIKASELSKRIDDEIGNISGMAEDIINRRN